MNIFQRYLHGRTKKKSTSQLRKSLFYGISIFLGTLLVSKKIDNELYYLMDANKANKILLKNNKYLREGNYIPTLFLFFGPMQNVYFKFLSKRLFLKSFETQSQNCKIITVPTHNLKKGTDMNDVPRVFVISSSSGFDHNMAEAMLRVHNNRFDVIGIVPKDFHDQDKLIKEIKQLKKGYQKNKHYAIGMEYGANLMVNSASKQPSLFEGMVSLANPMQLSQAQNKIQKSWFARNLYLNDIIKGRFKLFGKLNEDTKTLYDVDKILYGVPEDKLTKWKQQHSCLYKLLKVQVPCLFIQSQTDPFCLSLKNQELKQDLYMNPKCIYIQTKRGGHNIWYQSLNTLNWVFLVAVEQIRIIDEELRKNPDFSEV